MIKTAIFVEGQTELIFMREYLLKMFDYQNIWVECYTLFTDGGMNTTEYSFPNENAETYFQIINVGNDNAVLTRLLNREQYLLNSGFNAIFGIRDMYSRDYRDIVQNATINDEVNLKFIESAKKIITHKAKKAENIHFHFAIMEAESWILGFSNCFQYLHPHLTPAFIHEKLGIALQDIDPETTFFHPASVVKQVYALVAKDYDKSKSDINAIMSHIQKENFIELSQSGKCQSFNNIHQKLIPN